MLGLGQPREGPWAGERSVGRCWRISQAPTGHIAPDGALAGAIALLPDFAEQHGGHVLPVLPATRQMGEEWIEYGGPMATPAQELGGRSGAGKAPGSLVIQAEL